jgi:Tfp pilus assembly protein PilF
LVDLLRLRFRAPRPRLITEKIPWFAMSLAVAAITFVQQLQFGGVRSFAEIPLWLRTCNAEISYLVYLRQMIWPAGLACYYPYAVTMADQPMPRYMFLAHGGAALAVLIAVTWLTVRLRHTAPYLLFGWLWYLVTLLPVIGLAQAGLQAHADRFTYLPSLGITTAVVWGLGDLLRLAWPADSQKLSTIGSVLAGVAVAACLLVDRPTVAAWRDSETLFRRALDVAPSAVAHFHLGLHFDQNHRRAKALDEYRKALALDPHDARTRNNIAVILWFDGDRNRALDEYRKAVELDPRLAIARENLGEALLEIGDVSEALEHLTVAVERDPDSARAHYLLGRARAALGQLKPAEDEFRAAAGLKPDWAEAHNNLGAVLMSQGRFDDAEREFAAALALDPSSLDAHVNRAVLCAERGQLDAARDEFNLALRAVDLDTPTRKRILETMQHYHIAPPKAESPGGTEKRQKQ